MEARSYYFGILLKNEKGPFQPSYERLINYDSAGNMIDHTANNSVPVCLFANAHDYKTHHVKTNRADFFAQVDMVPDTTMHGILGDEQTLVPHSVSDKHKICISYFNAKSVSDLKINCNVKISPKAQTKLQGIGQIWTIAHETHLCLRFS